MVLFIFQGYFGRLSGRSASLSTGAALVVFVLRCLECEADLPGTDTSISLELIRRRRPSLAIQFHRRGTRQQDVVELDGMRRLLGTESDALALSGGVEGPEIGRRHEALAARKGLDWGGDEVLGVARRGEDIGGRAVAGHVDIRLERVALNGLRLRKLP